ncbi:hypothetical protein EDB84DRAFT_1204346 [Lactarius hengduanensis]|nr:hypothetical protein EDB84DRAFT_1204346 [Lactarius hengduanensis]
MFVSAFTPTSSKLKTPHLLLRSIFPRGPFQIVLAQIPLFQKVPPLYESRLRACKPFTGKCSDNEVRVGDGPMGASVLDDVGYWWWTCTFQCAACSWSHINPSPHAFCALKIVELLPLPCAYMDSRLHHQPEMPASMLYHHPSHCVAQARVLTHMLVSPSNEEGPVANSDAVTMSGPGFRTRCPPCSRTMDDSLLPYTLALSPSPCAIAGRRPPALPRAPPRVPKYRWSLTQLVVSESTEIVTSSHNNPPFLSQSTTHSSLARTTSFPCCGSPAPTSRSSRRRGDHPFIEERFLRALCRRLFQRQGHGIPL